MPTTKVIDIDAKSELEASASKPPSASKRHSKFYFDNTLVVIQIEDMLFNVHKYQLVKSKTFSEMFNMPKKDSDRSEEGLSPEHPIVIEGVKASDFEALLTVLYATHFSTNQPAPEASLIIPSFRLANKWGFSELRAYLLPLAEKVLDDVDKIAFAREFDIKSWLAPAHVRLCQRPEPLTTEEATKLGIHSLLLISRMREQFRPLKSSSNPSVNTYYCPGCISLSWVGGSYKCGGCNWQGNAFQHLTSASYTTNTATALTNKVNKWVGANCIFTESIMST